MARYLLLDVGAGTMDVLWYDDASGEHFKAVVKSPVRTLAEKAARLPKDIVTTGVEMGGGPISDVLIAKAAENRVLMTGAAAATIHHDPDRVRALGIDIVGESQAERAAASGKYCRLHLADLEPGRIKKIIMGMGVPFAFELK